MEQGEGAMLSPRDQALRLIDYLVAFEAIRNPPVRRTADHRLFRIDAAALPTHPAVTVHPGEDRWLTVDFVDLPEPPAVPDEIAALLMEPSVRPDTEPSIIPAAADATVEQVAAWEQLTRPARDWVSGVWALYRDDHRNAAAVKSLHRALFEQREVLAVDRETYELVWGFGRLTWTDPASGETVDHPLLTVPVEVDIDVRTQRVTVRPAGGPEIEMRMINGLDVHDPAGYAATRQEIADSDLDPWVSDEIADVLRRLVRAVDDHGTVRTVDTQPSADDGRGTARAVVHPGWTLFLRRRQPDSEGFLHEMRELYRDLPEVIPPPLRGILTSEDPATLAGVPASDGETSTTIDDELLLLPLPANEQQERILRTSRRQAGVVVQGPPGTGKSHTIANLISHFVAEGQRVLVTAEKEQALKVLADKVPEDIRDLTVSVLGADEDGRKRLGDAIRSIQTKVGLVDRRVADERIRTLTETIDRLDREYAEVSEQLRASRWAEFDTLPGQWSAGSAVTPQIAAGWVHDHADLGYIPDPITPGTACPLTDAEFGELLATLRTIDPADARQAVLDLPPVDGLPSGHDLAGLLSERTALAPAVARARTVLPGPLPVEPDTADRARTLAADLDREAHWRQSVDGTWVARVVQQCSDPRLDAEWADATAALADLRDQVFTLRKNVRAHDVQLPPQPGAEFEKDLADAAHRMRTTGKLGFFARDAKAAVESCRVDGQVPTTADAIQVCLDSLTVEQLRHRLATRWRNQTADVDAPALSGYPETSVGPHLDTLAEVRRTAGRWADLTSRAAALQLPALPPEPRALAAAASTVADVAAVARTAEIDSILGQLRCQLDQGAAASTATSWSDLRDALDREDTEAWQSGIDRVRRLTEMRPSIDRRDALLAELAAVAPVWATEMTQDHSAAGEPEDLGAAWQWRHLETWVRAVADRPAPAVLQALLDEVTAERRRTVTELVTEKAWRRLVDNLGHPQRQALEEYVQASKRFGKTGGKHASRWIAEMRRAMGNATTAVPVWIMPTARALLNFRPSAEPPFDVLIIDEASQIGMTALPLLALARRTIVVGDDQQTSPENVGLDREPVYRLMDDHLRDIPGYRTVFDPDKSLYDLALLRFSQPIMLTEHFRCLPQIIEFSNQLSYNGRIVPLRDRPPHPGWQPVRTVRVPDGYRSGFVNRPEAEAVVALLRDLDGRPEYDGMSFGVISLLSTQQSALIKELLYDGLGPAAVERRQIRVGEAASFQGDERDVMVVSTVIAVDPSKERTRYGAMTSEADKRRINVAASRARDQLWVVTSVDPSVLSPGDYRAALIAHCSATAADDDERGDLLARCESEFERRVVRKLLARGYTDVTVQHRVGQYRLDIVVSGPDARLAIECDGDRWHSEAEWDRDRARQQVLERAGWTFERIRGSAFYRDPDLAMEPVWERLEGLGIRIGERRQPVLAGLRSEEASAAS
ncbi:AAA domain-containing protein [Nakamurella flava]|nr:AAA domain-containing protein [Nakamurella flava]